MGYRVRLDKDAQDDLKSIFHFIRDNGATASTARGYINRILDYLDRFEVFPERGNQRDDIRPGLRIVGFERRISIAFVVQKEEVIVLRILYAGRQFTFDPALKNDAEK